MNGEILYRTSNSTHGSKRYYSIVNNRFFILLIELDQKIKSFVFYKNFEKIEFCIDLFVWYSKSCILNMKVCVSVCL